MTQSSRAVPETGVVEELRAHAGFVENGGCVEHSMTDEASLLRRAADALSAKDRELAEARAEIERLVRINAEICRGSNILNQDGARLEVALKAAERQRDEALEALLPFAEYITGREERLGVRETDGERMLRGVTIGDFRRARSVLENSKAGLADANQNNPSGSCEQRGNEEG